MHLTFNHSIVERSLGGAHGIPVIHLIDNCTRSSAIAALNNKDNNSSLEIISKHWINIFGAMEALILDVEAGVKKGWDVDDWAMQSQARTNYKPPRRQDWPIERHIDTTQTGPMRIDTQMRTDNLVAACNSALALVTFMHHALTCINGRTPYQALFGRQPHILPPLEGRYHGDLDAQGQNNIVRAR